MGFYVLVKQDIFSYFSWYYKDYMTAVAKCDLFEAVMTPKRTKLNSL